MLLPPTTLCLHTNNSPNEQHFPSTFSAFRPQLPLPSLGYFATETVPTLPLRHKKRVHVTPSLSRHQLPILITKQPLQSSPRSTRSVSTMAADKVDYVAWGRLRGFFATEPPWLEHIYVVRIVDFTVGVPADEGGTCDDGISPRPDEEIRSAIFIQTSEDSSLAGILYETHRWPGSSKFRLSVTQYANLGRHTHLATDAPVGFIWKKDAEQHLPDIINSIPTPDPSAIHAPGSVPDGSDLPPQDSIE